MNGCGEGIGLGNFQSIKSGRYNENNRLEYETLIKRWQSKAIGKPNGDCSLINSRINDIKASVKNIEGDITCELYYIGFPSCSNDEINRPLCVIDVDDENIKSLDNYISYLEENKSVDNDVIEDLRGAYWIPGNNRGIHIYLSISKFTTINKLDNVTTDGMGIDLVRSMIFERSGKKFRGDYIVEFDNLDGYINIDMSPKKKPVVEQQPKNTNNKVVIYSDLECDESYLEYDKGTITKDALALKVSCKLELWKYFKLSYTEWFNIALICSSSCEYNEGYIIFKTISEQDKNKGDLDDILDKYKKASAKGETENKLTIATIYKMIKDNNSIKRADYNAFIRTVNKEYKKLDVGNDETIDPLFCTEFNTEYFYKLKSSSNKLIYFSMFHKKIKNPSEYLSIVKDIDGNYSYYTQKIKDFIDANSHLKIDIENDKGESMSKQMVQYWRESPSTVGYTGRVFIPSNKVVDYNELINCDLNTEGKYFNSFMGFSSFLKGALDNGDQILEEQKDNLTLYLDIIRQLAGDTDEGFEYLINDIAFIIQYPEIKRQVSNIFCSRQGVGKDNMLKIISKIIGSQYVASSADPKTFFRDHSYIYQDKLLIVMDECKKSDNAEFIGFIKNLISCDIKEFNRKGYDVTFDKAYFALWFFTNELNGVKIDVATDNRRFSLMKCTSKYQNKDFWNKNYKTFMSNEFIRAFYVYLCRRDLSNFKINTQYIGPDYVKLTQHNIPTEILFLQDKFIQTIDNDGFVGADEMDKPIIISKNELYEDYKEYIRSNCEGTRAKGLINFLTSIKELPLTQTTITINGQRVRRIKIVPSELEDYLRTKNLITEYNL
jgi:hypothetical protein